MVGIRIKEIRKSKNITQKELSKRTGISISYIQQLEYKIKENPSLEILNSIANALGVRVRDLAEEDEVGSNENSKYSTFSSMDGIISRKYSDEKIKEKLKDVIMNFTIDVEHMPLEKEELTFLVEDCYKYIEFMIYKQKKRI